MELNLSLPSPTLGWLYYFFLWHLLHAYLTHHANNKSIGWDNRTLISNQSATPQTTKLRRQINKACQAPGKGRKQEDIKGKLFCCFSDWVFNQVGLNSYTGAMTVS